MKNISGTAIALTDGYLGYIDAKTTHGLVRGSKRFRLLAVIDYKYAGEDAGELVDGVHRGIPIFASIEDYLESDMPKADYCIIGVATSGGVLPDNLRKVCMDAVQNRMSIVNGLHECLQDSPEFMEAASKYSVDLIDIRKPRAVKDLVFWSGEILKMRTPRIAVLGVDCAVGKRTTAKFAWEVCNKNGVKAEMIYTGQTGWMQGFKHGFIFDSTVNDFISGEIERVILNCDKEEQPDVIFIEGQSALRNPSGPCGAEFILSGGAKGVIIQHVPFRKKIKLKGVDVPLPTIEEEIKLIELYGAQVIAITLNNEKNEDLEQLHKYQKDLERNTKIPVIAPMQEGTERLFSVIYDFIKADK